MPLTVFLGLVLAILVVAVVIFVAVVVGIHSEPRYQINTTPQRPLAAMIRHLLGVYVARPTETESGDDREDCLAETPPSGGTRRGGTDDPPP
jgi:hypothetical protein